MSEEFGRNGVVASHAIEQAGGAKMSAQRDRIAKLAITVRTLKGNGAEAE